MRKEIKMKIAAPIMVRKNMEQMKWLRKMEENY
jgi:hypothetical protein